MASLPATNSALRPRVSPLPRGAGAATARATPHVARATRHVPRGTCGGFPGRSGQARVRAAAGTAEVETALGAEGAMEDGGRVAWSIKGEVDAPFSELMNSLEDLWLGPGSPLGLDATSHRRWMLNSLENEAEWMALDHGGSPPALQELEAGAPGHPHLLMESHKWTGGALRKLSLSLVVRQDGLQVAHITAYPRHDIDFPMFGIELIGFGPRVSLAGADVFPVSSDRSLPEGLGEAMASLSQGYEFPENRDLKDHFVAVMSRHCRLFSPEGEDDVTNFCTYAVALAELYTSALAEQEATTDAARIEEVKAAQERYAEAQLKNPAMNRVLTVAFDGDFAQHFLRERMYGLPAEP